MAGVVAGLVGQLLAMASRKQPGGKHMGRKVGAPSHPMPRRVMPKVRRAPRYARSAPKSVVRNDGDGNQKMSTKHGRKDKPLGRKQEHRIRTALQPISTQSFQVAGVIQAPIASSPGYGKTSYTAFEMGSVKDIDVLIANASGNDGAAVGYAGRVQINDYSMYLKLVNQENVVANLRIYEYRARRDLPAPYGGTNGILQSGFGANATTQIDSSVISGTLFNNPLFCSYNKIVKVRDVQLAPGKELVLTLSHLKPKTINPLVWDQGEEWTEMNYTKGYVIQVTGQPLNGHTGGAVSIVTTSSWKLDFIQLRRYHFMEGEFASGATFLQDGPITGDTAPGTTPLNAGPPFGGIGQIMNQVSGAVEFEQQA